MPSIGGWLVIGAGFMVVTIVLWWGLREEK